MEALISKLLLADSEVIKAATAELNLALKNPDSIVDLCNLAADVTAQIQIRQYAAVLLKKHLGKLRIWQMIPPDQQQRIKEGMLDALLKENEKAVRNAIASLIGVLVRHEPEKNGIWFADILKLMYTYCLTGDLDQNEAGSSLFSVLTDTSPDQFIPQLPMICDMITSILVNSERTSAWTTPLVFNTLVGMTNLVPFILGHNSAEHTYQKCIPLIIKALQSFAIQNDPDTFGKVFNLLDNMADFTPTLLTTNIQPLLQFCLETSSNTQFDNSMRVKTVAYIGWLVRLKKKIIMKQRLIEPIIQVVFNVMATEPVNEDDDEDYFLGEDGSNPMTAATQTMDLLALNVPPEKLIPPLLHLLEASLQGADPLPRKAAYLCMAVIAEGCSFAITTKYLETMVNIIKIGILDTNPIVRNAAFFALGQFSEHLQPDICQYAPVILPILFDYLEKLCLELKSNPNEPKFIDRMFYALETFCENLEEGLLPHLPLLMKRLFQAVKPGNSVHLRELALSAMSAAANAVKENMLPYFPKLIDSLQLFTSNSTEKDTVELRPQALDTLAALARTIGKENFMPLANCTITYGLELLEESDEPELRRACYSLIASIAAVVNEDMSKVYPRFMERMINTINSADEVIPEYKESVLIDENDDNDIDLMNSDDEDDDYEGLGAFSVENSYLDEKEEAIKSIREFAIHTGAAFLPYVEACFQCVYKMLDHPQEDIRKASIDSLVALAVCLNNQNDFKGAKNAAGVLITKFGSIVQTDTECQIVIAALEGCCEILKELKALALPTEEYVDVILKSMMDVITGKVACQFEEVSSTNEELEDESEFGETLMETAGNLLPTLGKALSPSKFALIFGRTYTAFVTKMANKKEENAAQRAAAYGVLAESFTSLKNYSGTYFDDLLPHLLSGVSDSNDQVRQNAIFGLGELVLNAEAASYGSYNQILTALSEAVAKETKQGALDNICGAIARLITNNMSLVPLNHVLPVFLEKLPLKEDYEENALVSRSLRVIYLHNHAAFCKYVEPILANVIHVLYCKEYKDQEAMDNNIFLLKEIRARYPERYNMVVVDATPDIINFLNTIGL